MKSQQVFQRLIENSNEAIAFLNQQDITNQSN